MKYILLGVIFAGCVSIMQPNKGKHCFSWFDTEGVVHETCEATEDACREALDLQTEQRAHYRTNSDCDMR